MPKNQLLQSFIDLFNYLNFDNNSDKIIKLTNEYLPTISSKLKGKFIENNPNLPNNELLFLNQWYVQIYYFDEKYLKEEDKVTFNWNFISYNVANINGYEDITDDEPTTLRKFNNHFDSVTFSEVIEGIVTKYSAEITETINRKIRIAKDKKELESIINELIKNIEILLSKSKNDRIERYPIISETLKKLKEYLEGIDLSKHHFKSDFGISTANDNTDSEEENSISSSTLPINKKKIAYRGFYHNGQNESVNSITEITKRIWIYLKGRGLIATNTKLVEFQKIFQYGKVTEKTVWLGDLNQLYYFIKLLMEQSPYKNIRNYEKWQIAVNCFCLENQKDILSEQLQRTKEPKTEKKMEILEAIILFKTFKNTNSRVL